MNTLKPSGPIRRLHLAVRALAIFLPSFVLAFAGTVTTVLYIGNAELAAYRSNEQHTVDLQAAGVNQDMAAAVSDLALLVHGTTIPKIWNDEESPNPEALADLVSNFLNIATYKRLYHHLRLIDIKGMEIARVNFNDGRPAVVAREKLQDKFARYYFSETVKLDQNEIFISPLDLNVDNGQIEQPLRPIIRFSTPIFDRHGEKRGIMLLNYQAGILLERFANQAGRTPDSQAMLLNADGFWLHCQDPQDEWGFILEDRSARTFSADHAEAWERISTGEHGQFETSMGMFTFKTVYPLHPDLAGQNTASNGFHLASKNHPWKIVSYLPSGTLYAEQTKLRVAATSVLLLLSLALAAGAWRASKAFSLRQQAARDRADHLRFLENTERINEAIRQAGDTEQMMSNVLQATLEIFECDRAWLLHPCDPDTASWCIPMMRTTPEYRNDEVMGSNIPAHPDDRSILLSVLNTDAPVGFGSNNEQRLPAHLTSDFRVRAQLLFAIHPRTGDPWAFGLHQCSSERTWAANERELFRDIGNRLGNGLNSLLFLRDLKESEQRYRALVENAPEAIVVLDLEQQSFVDANQNAVELFKLTREELSEKKPADLSPPTQPNGRPSAEFAAEMIQRAVKGGTPTFEWTHRNSEGLDISCEVRLLRLPSTSRLLIRGSMTDITERKKLEDQLRQAQKMEAVGQLAGGVAHDFNNLLQVINGYTEMAIESLDSDHEGHAYIRGVSAAGGRATTLVQQLLAFSRRQVLDMKHIDLNDLIADLMKMIRRVIGAHIDLDIHAGKHLGLVQADPGQIEQILMNLCVNARDSMPGGGTITIESENVTIGQSFCLAHTWAEPGRHVLLTITDTGSGMDKKTIAGVFEPFFTTKKAGEGTGLGLSTVYGIVKQHGGMIHVYSEIDRGTTFKIYFPLVEATAASVDQTILGPAPTGTETVLIAEDDETVLELAQAFLETAGYTILTAVNGQDALQIFEERAGSIDLVILDVIMPKLGGEAAFESIRQGRPDQRVLFASGYGERSIHNNFLIKQNLHLIQKPFDRKTLLFKVREVLDA